MQERGLWCLLVQPPGLLRSHAVDQRLQVCVTSLSTALVDQDGLPKVLLQGPRQPGLPTSAVERAPKLMDRQYCCEGGLEVDPAAANAAFAVEQLIKLK